MNRDVFEIMMSPDCNFAVITDKTSFNSRYTKSAKYNNRSKRRRKREPTANRTREQLSGAGTDSLAGWNLASFIDSSGSLCKFFTHSGQDTPAPWFSTYKRSSTSWYNHISTLSGVWCAQFPALVLVSAAASLGLQTEALIFFFSFPTDFFPHKQQHLLSLFIYLQ